MCLGGNACGNDDPITLTFWECSTNYAGEECGSKICFNGSSTYVISPFIATTTTKCPGTTVTTTCGGCSDANCGNCAKTSGN